MEFLRIRSSALTWSLPPHPPPGRFAPRIFSPHYCFSRAVCPDGLTSKPHHAHRKFPRLMWIVLPATGIDFQPQTAERQIRFIIPRQGRVYKGGLENRKESKPCFHIKQRVIGAIEAYFFSFPDFSLYQKNLQVIHPVDFRLSSMERPASLCFAEEAKRPKTRIKPFKIPGMQKSWP